MMGSAVIEYIVSLLSVNLAPQILINYQTNLHYDTCRPVECVDTVDLIIALAVFSCVWQTSKGLVAQHSSRSVGRNMTLVIPQHRPKIIPSCARRRFENKNSAGQANTFPVQFFEFQWDRSWLVESNFQAQGLLDIYLQDVKAFEPVGLNGRQIKMYSIRAFDIQEYHLKEKTKSFTYGRTLVIFTG